MYNSETYGKLNIEEIPAKILDYYSQMQQYDSEFSIIIGSDSQTFDKLKLVNVIAVVCEGHGGIFFYEVTLLPRTTDVRQKLTMETNESLHAALKLIDLLEDDKYKILKEHMSISIHIDAGWNPNGKTKELIPALVGWIKGMGLTCQIKPESFVASSIADKLSK